MVMLKYFSLMITIWTFSLCSCQNKDITASDNPDDVIILTETQEANIWFLGHCGFAVQTLHYFLIFDYVEEHLRNAYRQPDNPSLSTGYIRPEEIKDLKVRVFTTHEHGDHYDPVIFDWTNHIADIEYFFGWRATNNTEHHHLIGHRASWQDEDMEIHTINSNHSGVPEVAYLVMVDGLAIYHNGDYQGNYQEDVSYLKTMSDSVDLAFLSCVWQEQWTYHRVTLELITGLQPNAAFPMHVRVGDEATYFQPFRETFQPWMDDGRVVLTQNIKGISFYYKIGEITQY